MHTHVTDTRHLAPQGLIVRFAWVPLCMLVLAVAISAVTGHALVPRADASTVLVQGDVGGGVYLDATQCGASAGQIGDVLLGTDAWRTAQDATSQVCKITFGAPGDLNGADLVLIDDPSAPGGNTGSALRCTTGACAGHSIADYTNAAEPSPNTSAFGTQLVGTPGGAAAAVWTAAPAVHGLQDSNDVACHTSNTSDGDCSFTWGVTGAANDTPGAYVAHVQSLVVGR